MAAIESQAATPCRRYRYVNAQSAAIMSNDEELLTAIIELNRNWLLLAKRLIVEDHANGARLFGLSDELTALIGQLTPAQIEVLSASDQLVCQFNSEGTSIFSSLLH
jgi:flagellar transcriptional activator FlhD